MTTSRSKILLCLAAAVAGFPWVAACSSSDAGKTAAPIIGADASPPKTLNDASSAHDAAVAMGATCPSGRIHLHVCTKPDGQGSMYTSQSNDPNASCPSGYTPDEQQGDAYCCEPPSATTTSTCTRTTACPMTPDGDCEDSYTFDPTNCSDDTWAAAHADTCGVAADDDAGT